MINDKYIEHEQVGKVRFMPADDAGQAAWYDYNGSSRVADLWLCESMAKLCGGSWRVTARYHAGNGNFWAEMRPADGDVKKS